MSTALVPQTRQAEVLHRILQIKGDLVQRALELGELLLEAKYGDYHITWGFSRFGDWVEASDLDMSERQAFYLIRIIERSRELGIPREQLEKVKLTKLKEIFTLKAASDEQIKQLVAHAETATLEDVKLEVQKAKQGGEDDEFTFLNLELKGRRVPRDAKASIEEAFEDIRKRHGNTLNSEGEVVDIPDWKALELICNEYLQDENRQELIQDAEYVVLPLETPTDEIVEA